MNHDRQMGFAWGAIAMAGVWFALALHPWFLIFTLGSLYGVWAFRHVH